MPKELQKEISLLSAEIKPVSSSKIFLSRLPSLDGWRAVSILLVLGFHSSFIQGFPVWLHPAFGWIFDGNLGVRFFFVISGFLITWLLLQEMNRAGSISLKDFYIRRCLRILPVYFTFLGVLALLQFFGAAKQSSASWIGALTFTRNLFGNDAISGHLWSLSVEEQFYLLWPGIFLLASGGKNLRTTLRVLIFGILLAPFFRALSLTVFYPSPPFQLSGNFQTVFLRRFIFSAF